MKRAAPERHPQLDRERVVNVEPGSSTAAVWYAMALSRMTTPVQDSEKQCVLAPVDWHEYYSPVRVEACVWEWLRYMQGAGAFGGRVFEREYHKVKGRYTYKQKGDRQRTVYSAKIDFVSVPSRIGEPVVMLEVDEDRHVSYGWAEQRGRELCILRWMRKKYKTSHLVFIRLNPHEYINKDKSEETPTGFQDVYTTQPDRDERMSVIGDVLRWAFALPSVPAKGIATRITVVFAYYDKWYTDRKRGHPDGELMVTPVHRHEFPGVGAYERDVRVSSKRPGERVKNRRMFREPKMWPPLEGLPRRPGGLSLMSEVCDVRAIVAMALAMQPADAEDSAGSVDSPVHKRVTRSSMKKRGFP